MRVLAVNWRDIRSPEAGGSEVYLHEVLQRLVTRGHSVTLIASQFATHRGPAFELVDGVETLRVGAWWNAHITVPRAARRVCAARPFDVVLDNVNKIPFFAPERLSLPTVAVFYHLLGDTVFLETNRIAATWIRRSERRIPRGYRSATPVAISRGTLDDLREQGFDAPDALIAEPGLDHAAYGTGERAKDPTPLVIVVSRLKHYKRVDVAIEAFARIHNRDPRARLVVIGSGDDRPRLERLVRRLRVPATFTGALSHQEKVSWLSRAHVVLNPSMKEGFGLVALEAMACGTPVVASDVPGHRDSVAEGAGILVPFGDADAMAHAAARVLADSALARELTTRGRIWARRFTWERTTDVIESALLRAVGRDELAPCPTTTAAVAERALR